MLKQLYWERANLIHCFFTLILSMFMKIYIFIKCIHLSIPYQFPIAAISNYYKLSGLKQHRFIFLQFWMLKVQNVPGWFKIKLSAWLCSFLETLGVNPFSCLFQLLEAAQDPGPKLTMSNWVFFHGIILILTFLLSSSTFKYPCDYTGSTWIIHANLHILSSTD